MISEYTVTGMTCDHCVGRVSGELSKMPDVTDVSVDLASGVVRITSESPISPADVAVAVDEAGYELADA